MTKQSRDTVKSTFENGDRPTGQQFIDLIDSSLDLCASGQPNLQGAASLQAGTNVTLTQTGSVIQIAVSGAFALAASGQPGLTSTASLQAGANITLTQTGSVIKIDGGAGTFTIAVVGETGLTSTASLASGSNITLSQSGSTITVHTTACTASPFALMASGGTPLSHNASLQTATQGFIAMTQTGSVIKFDTTASNARYIIETQVFS